MVRQSCYYIHRTVSLSQLGIVCAEVAIQPAIYLTGRIASAANRMRDKRVLAMTLASDHWDDSG